MRGRHQPVTIAVETVKITQLAREMRQSHPVTVAGHSGYCGTLGEPMLDLSLGGGKVLDVTAPCAEAEALAAKALPNVKA